MCIENGKKYGKKVGKLIKMNYKTYLNNLPEERGYL